MDFSFDSIILVYLIGKKTGVNFRRGKKLATSALFTPLKFYFKNLINGQVNWFIKIVLYVEVVFFFTTTVSVTDQFWPIKNTTIYSVSVFFLQNF